MVNIFSTPITEKTTLPNLIAITFFFTKCQFMARYVKS